MTSSVFQLSSNGGVSFAAPGVALADTLALAYASSGTYAIKARLDSTTGVESCTWRITSADDLHQAGLPAITPNDAERSCTFAVPKTGGAWLLEVLVNNRLRSRLAVKVRTARGHQVIAVGETSEAGAYGWTAAFNDQARDDGGGGDAVAMGGDVVGDSDGCSVVALRGVLLEEAAEGAGEEDGATLLSRQGAWTLIHGELSKSITAGGTIELNDGEHECHVLRLTGSPASDTTVVFPAIPGRTWLVTSEQTDRGKSVVCKADGGSRTLYLGPGQTRRLTVVNGEFDDDASGAAIFLQVPVSLVRVGAGNTDVTLCKLPAGVSFRGITTCGTEAPDATVQVSAGISAGGTHLQKVVDCPSVGDTVGDSAADDWGSALADNGRATFASAQTVYFRFTTDGTTTQGAVTVTIEAVRLTR